MACIHAGSPRFNGQHHQIRGTSQGESVVKELKLRTAANKAKLNNDVRQHIYQEERPTEQMGQLLSKYAVVLSSGHFILTSDAL